MNKRALKMQNEMLVKQVATLSSQIEGYKKRMEEYSLLLAARDVAINRLNGELQSAQSEQALPQTAAHEIPQEPKVQPEIPAQIKPVAPEEIPAPPQEIKQPEAPQTPPKETAQPEEIVDTAPKATEQESVTTGDLLDNRQKLAAETIAAITLKAAALDAFLQKSNDPNAKELQAMVLGKTELFKSQVFAVVKGGVDGAGFVASLETLKSQMAEYFENIKMQLR